MGPPVEIRIDSGSAFAARRLKIIEKAIALGQRIVKFVQ